MIDHVYMCSLLGAAGFSEAGSLAVWIMMIALVSGAPFYLIYHGSWLSLVGIILLGADIAAIIAVWNRALQLFRYRLHIPDCIVFLPISIVIFIPICIINASTIYGVILCDSVFHYR